MVLSEEDLCKIECDGFFLVDQVDLSIGSYYYKFAGAGEVFRELLGSKVFKMVGIKCAEYEYLPQKKCLMSKDLNSEQIRYLINSINELNSLCDYIIIDTGAGISNQGM